MVPHSSAEAPYASRTTIFSAQDALEVMRVTYLLTNLLSVSIDFTDVTLVSDDT